MTQTLISPRQPTEDQLAGAVDVNDLVACPECGHQAVVEWRADVDSTGGSIEHLKIRCANRHWFLMPSYLLAG